MKRLPQVKAVFFDLDDTLCAYWDAAKRGLRETFTELGPAPLTAEGWITAWADTFRVFCSNIKTSEWHRRYLQSGEPTRTELMRLTLASQGIDDVRLAEALSARYAHLRNKYLELFPEVRPVLDTLRPHYPLGLITNGPADIQRQEIERLGIGDYFGHVFIEGEVGLGKPHLSVFRKAEASVGLLPEQILFVGNSFAHDVQPAMEAGWHAAWICRDSDVAPSSRDGKPEGRTEGAREADYEIYDLREVLTILGRD